MSTQAGMFASRPVNVRIDALPVLQVAALRSLQLGLAVIAHWGDRSDAPLLNMTAARFVLLVCAAALCYLQLLERLQHVCSGTT
jgi:hypothetical protein